MQPASEHHIPDGLLASMTLLSEKPRHGVASRKSAPHPGINEANSTAPIGLRFRCWEIVSGTVDAPNNQQKSQKRQQCEVAAQQQYDQSNQNIQNSFLPNLKQSAVSGAIHGAIVGCVAGAVGGGAAGSVVGPEGTLAVAAVGCASLAPDIAAITAVSEATFSLGHSLWDAGAAYFTYKQQMNACSAF